MEKIIEEMKKEYQEKKQKAQSLDDFFDFFKKPIAGTIGIQPSGMGPYEPTKALPSQTNPPQIPTSPISPSPAPAPMRAHPKPQDVNPDGRAPMDIDI